MSQQRNSASRVAADAGLQTRWTTNANTDMACSG